MKNLMTKGWLEIHGFTSTEPNLYEKTMSKTVNVAFRGEMETSMTVLIRIDENAKTHDVVYKKDGRTFKSKVYFFGWNRTKNAILETVQFAGFNLREEARA